MAMHDVRRCDEADANECDTGMVLILIFGEVLGLYGLIVGLILNTNASG